MTPEETGDKSPPLPAKQTVGYVRLLTAVEATIGNKDKKKQSDVAAAEFVVARLNHTSADQVRALLQRLQAVLISKENGDVTVNSKDAELAVLLMGAVDDIRERVTSVMLEPEPDIMKYGTIAFDGLDEPPKVPTSAAVKKAKDAATARHLRDTKIAPKAVKTHAEIHITDDDKHIKDTGKSGGVKPPKKSLWEKVTSWFSRENKSKAALTPLSSEQREERIRTFKKLVPVTASNSSAAKKLIHRQIAIFQELGETAEQELGTTLAALMHRKEQLKA